MSRSELFSRAAARYLDELDAESTTCRIDLAVPAFGQRDDSVADALAAVITSDTALATMPGNVFMPAIVAGLPRDSVVNVTALVTLEEADLTDRAGTAPPSVMDESSERAGWQWAGSPPLCPRAPDRGKPRTRALSGRSQRRLRAPCKPGAS